MLPVIREFVARYDLDDFIVVADSGLMTNSNIDELERDGCKYIIGARIRTESEKVKERILSLPKVNGRMHEIDKGGGRRLLIGYTDKRAEKDSYNRKKGVRRLEKMYRAGHLTKENINRRGYNKFLTMEGGPSTKRWWSRMPGGTGSRVISPTPTSQRVRCSPPTTTCGMWSGLSASPSQRLRYAPCSTSPGAE